MQSEAPGGTDAAEGRDSRSFTIDRLAGAVLVVFSLLVLWECRKIPFGSMADPGPGAVPMLLALVLLVCSIVLIVAGNTGDRVSAIRWPERQHGVAILGTCAFLALALERLGYRLTIFIALLVLVGFVEKKGWTVGVIFAGAFSLGTYYLFDTLLKVPLPKGIFGL